MTTRRVLLGLAMVCAASASSSLTLGGVRGTVLVGQPLNIGIQMTVDGTEDARSLCIAAEVFSGDSRVDPSRVTISMDPPDANGNAVVRIRSNAAVEEAFVAVNLRAGCAQVSTRRYVMLADIITETVAEPAAQVGAPAATVPVQQSAPAPASAAAGASVAPSNGGVAIGASPASPVPASRPARAATPRPAAPKVQSSGVVKPAEPKPARAVAQPRLKLDSVQPLAAIDPNLRKSTELATTPAATPEKSAEAAALWRTLNAQPQDILREAQRLQGLEAEFKAFREQTNKNQAELAAQLQKAAEQRDQSMYVYILSGLLALAMVLVAGLWWSLRRRAEAQREWWEDRGQAGHPAKQREDGAASAADASSSSGLPSNGSATQPGQAPGGASREGAKEPAGAMQARSMAESRSSDARLHDKADHSEELFDVQQQADFFLSLGQTDQAIALLNNHIRSSEETSPLAYLELLRIYHSTGRTQEYEALRTSFMRVFNANVPDFQSYGEETRDLESYRGIVPSIQAAWGTPKGEKMLDEMMFRRPGSKWDHAFEMMAYAELSMLQGIAKEVSATPAGERNTVSVFGVLPLGNRAGAAAAGQKPVNALGLDLDLGGQEPMAPPASTFLEQRPEPKFSEDLPTRPGLLVSSGTPPKRNAASELPDNLVNFDPEPTPLPKLDPGKN